MRNLRKSSFSFISFFIIFLFILLFLIFYFPKLSCANIAEDLIARQGWKKISLDFENASLINILKIFSQQSGLNFIAAPEVTGKTITLYLENVPLREALDKILNSNNLTYILDEQSNIFVVKELIKPEVETITRIYALKHARVNSSPINKASASPKSGNSLVDAVQQRLSSYGKLSEDSRTNSLIITDVPYAFEVIEETIRRLDVPIPQVIIEAEIIDTTKQLVDSLGMEWSSPLYTLKLASRTNLAFPFHQWTHTETDVTEGGITAGSGASLQALLTDTQTKVLARPKILTLSNEEATIDITGSDFVGTITTTSGEGAGAQTSTQAERATIGVKLKVTPSVNVATGEITMVVEPSISSAEKSSLNPSFFNPQERKAKVSIVLKDNETVVIGGLIRKDASNIYKKIPILGDVPFLGALFRHKSTDTKDRELLVFITPRIVFPATDSDKVNLSKLDKPYDTEILAQREQSDYQYRKEEIDKDLSVWDNKK